MKNLLQQKKLLLHNFNFTLFFGWLILIIIYSIWYLKGGDCYVVIHDCLDSDLVWIKLLIESNNLLGLDLNAKVLGPMNGLERSFFKSGLNLTFLFFILTKPFQAYVLNSFLVHSIGYFGFFLLAKKHLSLNNVQSVMFALVFGLLNYWTLYGISGAGQPILLYAFLNILKKDYDWKDWVIICLFPFYSFFVLTVPFFVFLLALLGLFNYIENRKINITFIKAILIFLSISILIEFPLFYNAISSNIESHRSGWKVVNWSQTTLEGSFNKLKLRLFDGTYNHMGFINTYPIYISLAVLLIFKRKINQKILLLLLLFLSIALFEAFFNFNNLPKGLKEFNFSRFVFLLPTLILILIALISKEIGFESNLKKVSIIGIWLISLFSVYNGNDELNNLIEKRKTMTYHKYFDKYLFASIREELENNHKDYGNVLCVGFEPNIAQFNGIKTLDSYQNNYRLDFKNEFYKIIQDEIKKDSSINSYFTEYGSRCYSFSSELYFRYIYTKHDTINIKNLNYNFEQAKYMNANYLLSAVEILNNTKIQFIKKFETVDSYRKIYLYKIL